MSNEIFSIIEQSYQTGADLPIPKVDTLINKLNKKNFQLLLEWLDDNYHNNISLVSDYTYDKFVDIYQEKYGEYNKIGALPKSNKVKLPYFLPNLKKITEEKEINRWLSKYDVNFIVEDKLDGLTLMLIFKNGDISAYTRGDGTYGQDVSHLVPYLTLPKISDNLVLRGELLITRDDFNQLLENGVTTQDGTIFKNSRNMISSVVNSKEGMNVQIINLAKFYPYRIIYSSNNYFNEIPSKQLKVLQRYGFEVPNYSIHENLTMEILINEYTTRNKYAPYDMDGLVIYPDMNIDYPDTEAPSDVKAFKMINETAVTIVTEIFWRASMNNYLKPTVYYLPVELSGATLSKATGNNARYIIENGIGKGAKILITRSGETIPKILEVIESVEPDYPDPNVHGEYDWNENEVELVVKNINSDVIVNKLYHFVNTLEIKNLGRKRLEILVEHGINNVEDLILMDINFLQSLPGIGTKLSLQIISDINKIVSHVSLAKLMDASGFFPSIGEKRFNVILSQIPNLLSLDDNSLLTLLPQVDGINKLSLIIVENLPYFNDWLNNLNKINTFIDKTNVIGNDLEGKTYVFSGFRDKKLEENIVSRGGKVVSTVNKNVSAVIMKDIDDIKGKAEKALKFGIPLIDKKNFL